MCPGAIRQFALPRRQNPAERCGQKNQSLADDASRQTSWKQSSDVGETPLIPGVPTALQGVHEQFAIGERQDDDKPIVALAPRRWRRWKRGADQAVRDFKNTLWTALSFQGVEQLVAHFVNQSCAVGHDRANQILLGSKIIANRSVIFLACGFGNLAYRHRIDPVLRKELQRNAHDLFGRGASSFKIGLEHTGVDTS